VMLMDGPAPAKLEFVAVPILAIPDIVTKKKTGKAYHRWCTMFIYIATDSLKLYART